MKIFIVTRFFYPEITPRAFRAYELAKELSRTGHDVTVFITHRDYDYKTFTEETGVKVKAIVPAEPKFLTGRDKVSRFVRFFLDYFFLYPYCLLSKGFKDALKGESKCDLLISIAYPYPVHFGVALAKLCNPSLCRVWVADCGDPFTGNQEARLPMPFYFRLIEKWFLRNPDYITVPVVEAIAAYSDGFQEKFRVIPQGFDFAEYLSPDVKTKNSVPTFSYAGNLSIGTRDPRPFLDFLADSGIQFKFIIYTRNKEFLEPYIRKLNCMLEIRDYIPRRSLLYNLSEMDFLVNFENKGEKQKPSKLIDYALVGRPILSVPFGQLNQKVILEFLDGNYSNALDIGDVSPYDIRNVATAFLALADPVLSH